ncbi:MAG: ATP-dependent helicase RecG [Patescibacteria group bacterium]|nr:ATP-dependent helicase RecG [Patescibacteria group bacterium]
MNFHTPLSTIPSITPYYIVRLKKLGIITVRDLLFHFPNRYEDYSIIRKIDDLVPDERATICGTVASFKSGRTFRKNMLLAEATITDESGSIRIIWFNQKFVAQTVKPGMEIRISGKVSTDKKGVLFSNPAFERAERDETHTGRLVPIYPETAGLTSKFFRWQVGDILKKNIHDIPDFIPQDILTRLHLPSLAHALAYIHFPKTEEETLIAQKRFAFNEMLLVQLKVLLTKSAWDTSNATPFPRAEDAATSFIKSLPYELTNAQKRATTEILADLTQSKPMNRLLNGDVGSGKTAVAAIACGSVAEADHQSALLAPTEVLARQHYETFFRLFQDTGTKVSLLTQAYQLLDGKPVARATLLAALKAGMIDILIGTHAIIQKDIVFKNLSLIVVDEQHRFGVAQRAYLQDQARNINDGLKNTIPHLLSMTATPIPRTLTLAYLGNLELSLLDEMPKARKPIITKIAQNNADRNTIYEFIRKHITEGRQAFVILPLVEESEALATVKAATVECDRLKKDIFPELSIGLLHGRLKSKEKETIMLGFKEKKYDILVATSVVEVGIDIPNASVMLIEDADRFGLSQLHQFRGRVGRGIHQSYCFLFPGENASTGNARLKILEKTNDGFEIAEEDLKLRGPGSFFGIRQSGLPDVAMENLANIKLVKISRTEAENILKQDPRLENHPLLQEELRRFEERIHLE